MPAIPFTHTLTSLVAWGGPVNSGSGCLSCVDVGARGKVRADGGGYGPISIAYESKTASSPSLCGFRAMNFSSLPVDSPDLCKRWRTKSQSGSLIEGRSGGDDPGYTTSEYRGTVSYVAGSCTAGPSTMEVRYSSTPAGPGSLPPVWYPGELDAVTWSCSGCGSGGTGSNSYQSSFAATTYTRSGCGSCTYPPSVICPPTSPCYNANNVYYNTGTATLTLSEPDTVQAAIDRATPTIGTLRCASTGRRSPGSCYYGSSTKVAMRITGTGVPETSATFTLVFETTCTPASPGGTAPAPTYTTSTVTLAYGVDGTAPEQTVDIPQPEEGCSTCVECILDAEDESLGPPRADPAAAAGWGADEAAQFPATWPTSASWYNSLRSYHAANFSDIPAAKTELIEYPAVGRVRLAVADTYYPGQAYTFAWDVVRRQLGYDIKRSTTECGTTTTTTASAYSLEDPLTHPEDAAGSLNFADSSWGDFGYAIVSVPVTPSESGSSPTSGYYAAGEYRRSRIRFAMRAPGVFTFKLRKLDVNVADAADYTTSLATVSTSGTFADDGTNSTSYADYAPSAIAGRRVYLFVDEVKLDGVPVVGWLALAKTRDGNPAFTRFDADPESPAAPYYYKTFKFTQATTVNATAAACDPPVVPPAPGPANPCDASAGTPPPLITFTQTQVWKRTDPNIGAWTFLSCTGAGAGGASWTGEVSQFDEVAFASGAYGGSYPSPDWALDEATDWTVTATAATLTEVDVSAAALRAEFARVAAVPNSIYGGAVLGVTRGTSASTVQAYGGVDYRISTIIPLAPAEGESIQIAAAYVTGV